MNPFLYEASDYAPKADFNNITGIFELEGISRPENVSAFYNHVIGWLKEFEQNYLLAGKKPENGITVNFKLTYCNSASSKYILQLLEIIKSWEKHGVSPRINWFYDESDEKMKEDGQDIADALEYNFSFYAI